MSYQAIAPKPTKYNGRQYRSRLEARWAAFFDLLQIQFEYEPYDLEGWSPDFELKVKYPAIIEIKPLNCWDDHAIYKIRKHANYYTCLLLHDEIYISEHYEVFIGKQVLPQDESLILMDYKIAGHPNYIYSLWVEAANRVMFLKPSISATT